jgi:hypothetical protein
MELEHGTWPAVGAIRARKRTVITRGATHNRELGRGLRWAYQSHLTGTAHPRFTRMGAVVTDAGNMTTHANATNEQRTVC